MRRASTAMMAALVMIAFGFPLPRWEPTAALAASPRPLAVKIRSNNGKVSFEVSGGDVQAVIRAFKQVQTTVAAMEGKAAGTSPAKEPPPIKDKPKSGK